MWKKFCFLLALCNCFLLFGYNVGYVSAYNDGSSSGKVLVINLDTNTLIKEITGFTRPEYLARASNGGLFVADIGAGCIYLVNPNTYEFTNVKDVASITGMTCMQNSPYLLVTTGQQIADNVFFLDLDNNYNQVNIMQAQGCPFVNPKWPLVNITPDSSLERALVVNFDSSGSPGDFLSITPPQPGQEGSSGSYISVIGNMASFSEAPSFACNPAGGTVLSSGQNQYSSVTQVTQLIGGGSPAQSNLLYHTPNPYFEGVAFSSDGTKVYQAAQNGFINVYYAVKALTEKAVITGFNSPQNLAFSIDNTLLIATDIGNNSLWIVNPANNVIISEIKLDIKPRQIITSTMSQMTSCAFDTYSINAVCDVFNQQITVNVLQGTNSLGSYTFSALNLEPQTVIKSIGTNTINGVPGGYFICWGSRSDNVSYVVKTNNYLTRPTPVVVQNDSTTITDLYFLQDLEMVQDLNANFIVAWSCMTGYQSVVSPCAQYAIIKKSNDYAQPVAELLFNTNTINSDISPSLQGGDIAIGVDADNQIYFACAALQPSAIGLQAGFSFANLLVFQYLSDVDATISTPTKVDFTSQSLIQAVIYDAATTPGNFHVVASTDFAVVPLNDTQAISTLTCYTYCPGASGSAKLSSFTFSANPNNVDFLPSPQGKPNQLNMTYQKNTLGKASRTEIISYEITSSKTNQPQIAQVLAYVIGDASWASMLNGQIVTVENKTMLSSAANAFKATAGAQIIGNFNVNSIPIKILASKGSLAIYLSIFDNSGTSVVGSYIAVPGNVLDADITYSDETGLITVYYHDTQGNLQTYQISLEEALRLAFVSSEAVLKNAVKNYSRIKIQKGMI